MMCFERIKDNQKPACVEACPNQVMQFGDRDKLLEEAHKRIAENPTRYKNHVWGEEEYGGTSIMYLSNVDLDVMDWPHTDALAIPELTEPLISKTPVIGLSVAGSILGLNWIIGRRMKLNSKRNSESESSSSQTGEKQDNG